MKVLTAYRLDKMRRSYPTEAYTEINDGLHAYQDLYKADEICYDGRKIVEMWIPKGAKYYLGVNGDIVSNQMVWYK